MDVMLIGDVHQKHKEYLEIIKNAEYSLQLGDFGFEYYCLKDVDHSKHSILGGNHDNYSLIKSGLYRHFLNDYGWYFNDIFYIRGGFSLDYRHRAIGIDWWPEEQIDPDTMEKCFEFYKQVKPRIVVSHEAPRDVIQYVGKPGILERFGFNPETFTTRTSEFLQRCLDVHYPNQWFFGHYHKSWRGVVGLTIFQCLAELETKIIKI